MPAQLEIEIRIINTALHDRPERLVELPLIEPGRLESSRDHGFERLGFFFSQVTFRPLVVVQSAIRQRREFLAQPVWQPRVELGCNIAVRVFGLGNDDPPRIDDQ